MENEVKGMVLINAVDTQFNFIKQFAEAFDNQEQKQLVLRMEEIAKTQPTSIVEYDKIKKELGAIQKRMNAYNKLNIDPIKRALDDLKKQTALAYEKITTERIKQLKKEKEQEAIAIGLLIKEVKPPVADVRKEARQKALEQLQALMIERQADTELVARLQEIYRNLVV